MLGSFSVGKTSLVKRYVSSLFDEKYHTTIGVKIDKKQVSVEGQELTLMLWDIAGEDAFFTIRPAHLRGMAGAVIVIDGTRESSFDVALSLYQMLTGLPDGQVPVCFALNKADLTDQWIIDDEKMQVLEKTGCEIVETSALENRGVDEVFQSLAGQILCMKQAV
ncbi:MAG: Rab family GTPase [Thiolinea sp.]